MEHCPPDEGNSETPKPKATYDPGWNDPPLFSFDAINATVQSKTPKKTLLNKRVAFPMSSQQQSSSGVSPIASSELPLVPPINSAPPVISVMQPTAELLYRTDTRANPDMSITQKLSKDEALEKVLRDFESILAGAAKHSKKNDIEIRRRLDIMKKMWEDDKLKPEIHLKMVQLSEELVGGNADQADHIHVGLMVDHVSLCSPWMVGVRQLIHYVKSEAANQERKEEASIGGIPAKG